MQLLFDFVRQLSELGDHFLFVAFGLLINFSSAVSQLVVDDAKNLAFRLESDVPLL